LCWSERPCSVAMATAMVAERDGRVELAEGDVRDAAAAVAELTSRVSTRDADSRHRQKQREHELMAVRHPSSAYP